MKKEKKKKVEANPPPSGKTSTSPGKLKREQLCAREVAATPGSLFATSACGVTGFGARLSTCLLITTSQVSLDRLVLKVRYSLLVLFILLSVSLGISLFRPLFGFE